jgi:hypothetical protein
MTLPVAAWWRDEAGREEERARSLSWEVVAAEVAARRRPAWGEDAGEDEVLFGGGSQRRSKIYLAEVAHGGIGPSVPLVGSPIYATAE